MATTISNLGLVEATQIALTDMSVVNYMPNVVTQFGTGRRKGDTATVQLITAAAAADYNASSQNYLTSGGTIAGVKVLMDKHKVVTLEIDTPSADRVAVQNVVNAAVRNIFKAMAADVFGLYIAATYTNTASVVGASSAFTFAKYQALSDIIFSSGLDVANTTVAIQSAYASKLMADSSVATALAFQNQLIGGNVIYPTIAGMRLQRTADIPTGTNVVGAILDNTSACLAMGTAAPFADDNTVAYQEVVDPATGFSVGIREVINVATGSKFVTIEAVYGVKAAATTKATLLTSA